MTVSFNPLPSLDTHHQFDLIGGLYEPTFAPTKQEYTLCKVGDRKPLDVSFKLLAIAYLVAIRVSL